MKNTATDKAIALRKQRNAAVKTTKNASAKFESCANADEKRRRCRDFMRALRKSKPRAARATSAKTSRGSSAAKPASRRVPATRFCWVDPNRAEDRMLNGNVGAQQSTVQDCPRIIRRKTTTDLPTCGSRYSLTRTGASRPYFLTSMIAAVPVSHMVLYWWYM